MIEITFDTNMWKRLVNADMLVDHPASDDILRVKKFVHTKIKPYFCDAAAFESIDRTYRKDYLAAYLDPDLVLESFHETGVSSEGLVLGTSKWKMTNPPDRPMNTFWKRDFELAIDANFQLIRSFVPAFGSIIDKLNLGAAIYKELLDNQRLEVLTRYDEMQVELEGRGLGSGYAKSLIAKELNVPIDTVNLLDLCGVTDSKIVSAVSEWIDGIMISSHYAYGHDCFCTLDTGAGLGKKSIMHLSHRSWLKALGVEVIDAKGLADFLDSSGI